MTSSSPSLTAKPHMSNAFSPTPLQKRASRRDRNQATTLRPVDIGDSKQREAQSDWERRHDDRCRDKRCPPPATPLDGHPRKCSMGRTDQLRSRSAGRTGRVVGEGEIPVQHHLLFRGLRGTPDARHALPAGCWCCMSPGGLVRLLGSDHARVATLLLQTVAGCSTAIVTYLWARHLASARWSLGIACGSCPSRPRLLRLDDDGIGLTAGGQIGALPALAVVHLSVLYQPDPRARGWFSPRSSASKRCYLP